MRQGHRFCGRCGHELKPAARFCGSCGRPVPGSGDQVIAEPAAQELRSGHQAPEPSAYSQTMTSAPIAARPSEAVGLADSREGGMPPTKAPPGTGPPLPGARARSSRPPAFLWPLVVGLALLIAGGGTVTAVFLVRHSHGQSSAQENVASISARTATPTSTTPLPSSTPSTPPPPPTQVSSDGVTIGIGAVNTDPDAAAVAATLAAYFGGIDARNYTQAWDTYTAALQAAIPFQSWSGALSTSQDSQVTVQSIQHDANGLIDADVSFTSHQAGQYGPNPGETCTDWSLDYQFVPSSNSSAGPASLSYLISKVTAIGAGHTSC